MLRAGLRRIAITLLILSAVAIGMAFLFKAVWEMDSSRAFPLAFYAIGVAVALGGFMSATMGPVPAGFPQHGGALVREQGYYTPVEHHRALNNALVYGAFGVALVLLGAALDWAL